MTDRESGAGDAPGVQWLAALALTIVAHFMPPLRSHRRRGSPTAASNRTRRRTSRRDVPALAATLTEPMWIGYAQPLIDGDHQMCDYWNNGNRYTQSTDPIRLEPADFFFVMFRVEEKQITRIRTYSANCPLDAGGKAVHWFTNVRGERQRRTT